ncbi:spore coat polysaccharide biosynthesis protein SpsF [Persephonella hydrogeniphila]|uniref:Spore coat polysaccharide biosynthesis protein SpsF n=1 Tax=Persephonella hydrogeniphila TaxID=198703 RepID=A0A285N7U6_9AQUI|nr:glycosyltransferase family protein [Persephonella hydrogeniphila]SNZ03781.1 spore coat polysaccharide biosynthesis protein SpsF [Persephonella hydrogeniphila]
MKIGAIIQARTSSIRLPQKVLRKLPYDSDITVLQQVIRRTKKSKSLDEVIVATTVDKEDEIITEIAEKEEVKWFRGSRDDVLSRYYRAAKENGLDIIIRITSDCPCIDWDIIDNTVSYHLKSKVDYTSNSITKPFPLGLGVEVINFEALEKSFKNAEDAYYKEHVTTYIRDNPNIFRIGDYKAPEIYFHPEIRLTLDTIHDYALLCYIFDSLYYKNEFFSSLDALNLLIKKEWPLFINKHEVQKKRFSNLQEEIKEAIKLLEVYGFSKLKDFVKRYL